MSRKRMGIITGAGFALLSLVLTVIVIQFFSNSGSKVGAVLQVFLVPGSLLLAMFTSPMALAHGGFIYLYATNSLAYFAIGFGLGYGLGGARQVLAILIVLSVSALGFSYWRNVHGVRQKSAVHIQKMLETNQNALKSDPWNIYALHWIGVHNLTRVNDLGEAQKYFQKVIDIESRGELFSVYGQRALIYLAVIQREQGHLTEAEQNHRAFMGTTPDLEKDIVLKSYNDRYLEAGRGTGP